VKKGLLLFAGLIMAALFVLGVIRLFELRFAVGDVYPPYSSLRTDPLGAKAFYQGLQNCCGLKLERNYEPLSKIKNRNDAALFFTGLQVTDFQAVPADFMDDLEYFVRNGGRLILTLLPENDASAVKELLDDSQKKELKKERDEEESQRIVSIFDEWGFKIDAEKLMEDSPRAHLFYESIHSNLPEELPNHTVVFFKIGLSRGAGVSARQSFKMPPAGTRAPQEKEKPGKNKGLAWREIYRFHGHPVLMEAPVGKGSIVLSATSYFLSNEAMTRERSPELLLWLIGGKPRVIFDEYHHGVALNPGVATLARKYDLQWLFFALILIALLYIWKNSVSLVPSFSASASKKLATGKDATAGLTNLLKRSIPESQVLQICWEEYKKSTVKSGRVMDAFAKVQTDEPSRNGKQISQYNSISRILHERK